MIYLVAADERDDRLDRKGTLACSVVTQNLWFEQASIGWRWRFDTFKARLPDPRTGRARITEVADVTFVRSALPGDVLGNAFVVEDELIRLGFDDPDKRYLSFVEARADFCGDAIYPLVAGSAPVDGKYAQVYLLTPEQCHSREFGSPGKGMYVDATAQQELIHNDALVGIGAPHTCFNDISSHVCTVPLLVAYMTAGLELDPERFDVMYPIVYAPLSEAVLDGGNDDYFDHPFPHLRDLVNSPYVEKAK